MMLMVSINSCSMITDIVPGGHEEAGGGDGAMNSVKQVPAWFWLLIVGAWALKAAKPAFDGIPTPGFAPPLACSVAAPFLALAVCRWRYWSPREANTPRPPAAPAGPPPVDP